MNKRHMIKAIIAYDGTDYQGFQRQTRYGVGIQQILEKALSTALHEPILVKAAGRTDAGVHALGQVISFETSSPIPPENYRRAVAHLLPKDIALREAELVPDEFHARFDAVDKTYRYEVDYSPLPDPCAQRFAWLIREEPSLEAMNEAAALLVGTHDFSSFQNHGSQETSPVRTMYEAYWTQQGNRYFFTIRGDGFLYRMVRNIVGCLVKVGTGKWTKDDFAAVMAAHDRKKAGMAAPACGLFLMHVSY